ncbi:MAG TPA: acyl-ACP--UDP-N-acetylglucosamine O-acyltransferase [Oculatellaceae cyanobacterium]
MPIHKTAIIEDGAIIDPTAEIGPYVVIGPNVKIGAGTKIGAHSVIDGHTTIGNDCKIYASASIGLDPQDISYKGQPTGVSMGDRVTVREFVTVHRASKEGVTVVGDDCFLMAYSHVAHDDVLGKGVIMANGATLAGHVTVGDHTVMAGVLIVHQFVRIGRLNMISGMTGTRLDLPPFAMCDGRPTRVRGVNIIGMRRQKMAAENRSAIKKAFRMIYRSDENITQALERIENEIHPYPEIVELVDFYRTSKRGVTGKTAPDEDAEANFGDDTD